MFDILNPIAFIVRIFKDITYFLDRYKAKILVRFSSETLDMVTKKDANSYGISANAIPGFLILDNDRFLSCKFELENIGEREIKDITFNFYLRDEFTGEYTKKLLNDNLLVIHEEIPSKGKYVFNRIESPLNLSYLNVKTIERINPEHPFVISQTRCVLDDSDFSKIYNRREIVEKTWQTPFSAKSANWNLIFSYKNFRGSSYFSIFRLYDRLPYRIDIICLGTFKGNYEKLYKKMKFKILEKEVELINSYELNKTTKELHP